MSTPIGTNFDYSGPRFLDARQNKVLRKEELKNWTTLIPLGFQVYVEGEWYLYNPDLTPDPITGYFHKLFSDSLRGAKGTGIAAEVVADEFDRVNSSVDALFRRVYPLRWKWYEGGGYFEAGSSVTPDIIWSVERNGQEVTPIAATVNDSTVGIQQDLKRFIASSPISTTTSYEVNVVVDNDESISHIFEFIFTVPRFYGVSEFSTMTSDRVLGLQGSDWGQNNELPAMIFDCDGGKYPWICIPSETWDSHPKTDVWVEGIRSGDIESYRVNVKNTYGVTKEYVCFRLGYIQTGVLKIELR